MLKQVDAVMPFYVYVLHEWLVLLSILYSNRQIIVGF